MMQAIKPLPVLHISSTLFKVLANHGNLRLILQNWVCSFHLLGMTAYDVWVDSRLDSVPDSTSQLDTCPLVSTSTSSGTGSTQPHE
jgi:hypothetical protein